ncbi:MAG: hypothetical protein LBU65_13760 [Planctomycetaceae bacterium]|jgi:hypothetical protein|nr:hypothetical protein [Planctomycetaceae bacterium]
MRKVLVIIFVLVVICSGIVLIADLPFCEHTPAITNPQNVLATLQPLVPTEAEAEAISNLRKKTFILTQQQGGNSKTEPLPTESAPVNNYDYQISIEYLYIFVSEPLAKMITSNATLSWSGLPISYSQISLYEDTPSGLYSSNAHSLPSQIQVRFLEKSNAEKFTAMIYSESLSNVIQPPKITVFSGQEGSIQDLTQSPFVTSVLPVEEEIAGKKIITYKPITQIFNEGFSMSSKATLLQDDSCRLEKCNTKLTKIDKVETYKLVNGDPNQLQHVRTAKNSQPDSFSLVNEMKTQCVPIQCPSFSSLNLAIPEITIPHNMSLLVTLPGIITHYPNGGNYAVFLLVTPRAIHPERHPLTQHKEPEVSR